MPALTTAMIFSGARAPLTTAIEARYTVKPPLEQGDEGGQLSLLTSPLLFPASDSPMLVITVTVKLLTIICITLSLGLVFPTNALCSIPVSTCPNGALTNDP